MTMPSNYIRILLLFGAMVVSLQSSWAQEICNNGKDDDNDGLTDLYDPECQCRFTVNGNLLLNGSFELFDHCPVNYAYDIDHNIANNWEYGTYTNINEAVFYHHLSCVYDSGQVMLTMPPATPLPDGKGFISIRNNAYNQPVPQNEMTKSYVGQCLQAPLQKGEDYTLSFYAGRFRSWDNLRGKIFPFTVAVFGNADCNAVPFGKIYASGNGCPANYPGWVLLGKTTVYSYGDWVQSVVHLIIPFNINTIQIGPDCSALPPIADQADSTTFLDYHLYYLDDMHLLPTKDFPFQYIHLQTGVSCNINPVLKAPVLPNASYQWYKDSVAIIGATDSIYELPSASIRAYYNVVINTTPTCIITEPFLVTPSNLSKIQIPADTTVCLNASLLLAPGMEGISYTINGVPANEVMIKNEGLYTIMATDIYGCQKLFATQVVAQNCIDCDAFIPNAFTPNGDGLNDVFRARIDCSVTKYHCRIFNRWGKIIFSSNNPQTGWNGAVGGTKMPAGSYVYFIEYTTAAGRKKIVKGVFTLL